MTPLGKLVRRMKVVVEALVLEVIHVEHVRLLRLLGCNRRLWRQQCQVRCDNHVYPFLLPLRPLRSGGWVA